LVRSMLLRGFDRDIVEKIQVHMEACGTKLLVGRKPERVEKLDNGQLKVREGKGEGERCGWVVGCGLSAVSTNLFLIAFLSPH
jgi:hypothetical protein